MLYRILQPIISSLQQFCEQQFCQSENFASAFSGTLSFLPIADAPFALDGTMMGALAAIGVAAGVSWGVFYRRMSSREEHQRLHTENTEAQLRALLTMTDDAVLVLDAHGVVRVANVSAEELFSTSANDFEGIELTQFIPQPLCLGELTRRGPVTFDSIAMRPGGRHVNVEVYLSEVELAHSTSYLVLVREKGAQPTPSTATIPDLVAPVSKYCHDLNNQLTAILGNLSLILMSAEQDTSILERVMSAKKNALRAQEMTGKLLSVTKGDEDTMPEINTSPAHGTIVPMPKPSVSTAPAKNNSRVLILDDEEAICALVASALSSMGYDVTEATSVPAALLACEQAVKTGCRFQLVISDLSLPGDLSGNEAVARLRDIDPQIKAIISSGYDSDPIMTRFRDHGFAGAISKPYEISKLSRIVSEVLAGGDDKRKFA